MWYNVNTLLNKGEKKMEIEKYMVETPAINKITPNMINIIDDVLRDQREFRRKTSHYPSSARVETEDSIIGDCIRKQFYYWRNENLIEIDPSGLWKMDMGEAIHNWVDAKLNRELVSEIFDEVYQEFTIEYHPEFLKYPVRGRIDNLIVSEHFGNFGLEIKSGYGNAFTHKEYGVINAGPKISHLLQALTYLYISRFPQEEKDKWMSYGEDEERPIPLPNLDYFQLFYIARDNAYRTYFNIDILSYENIIEQFSNLLDESRIEKIKRNNYVPVVVGANGNTYIYEDITFKEIIKSYYKTEKYLEAGITPPRDFYLNFRLDNPDIRINTYTERIEPIDEETVMVMNKKASDWNCMYCPFNVKCWVEDEQEKQE